MADLEGDDNDNSFSGTEESDILFGHGGDDSIFGAGGLDAIFGGEGDDVLDGGAGADHLEGGGGQNVLFGGEGNDTLLNYAFEEGDYDYFGGSGADSFWSLAEGTTIIHDFSALEGDVIRVEQDDFIRAEVVDLDGFGPALLINGENTDTYILPSEEAPLDMLDDILFI